MFLKIFETWFFYYNQRFTLLGRGHFMTTRDSSVVYSRQTSHKGTLGLECLEPTAAIVQLEYVYIHVIIIYL